MTDQELIDEIPVFTKQESEFEVVVTIRVVSKPLDDEPFYDWKRTLEDDVEARVRRELNGHDDFGDVHVELKDYRSRPY